MFSALQSVIKCIDNKWICFIDGVSYGTFIRLGTTQKVEAVLVGREAGTVDVSGAEYWLSKQTLKEIKKNYVMTLL